MISFGGKGWIGIDVGTYSIKAAQVERVHSEMRLVDSVIVPRRSPLSNDQNRIDKLTLLKETQAALALGRKFSGRKAACVLPIQFQDFRSLTLPPGSQQERSAMIASELAATGQPAEDYQFDFWNVPRAQASESSDIYMLSMPRETARAAAIDMRRAGLECRTIDGLPFTMARAVTAFGLGRVDAPVAVIDWGYSSTTFCLSVNGQPRYCRPLPDCSLQNLLVSVGQGLGISEDRQHHLLLHYGLPNDAERDPTRRAVQSSICDLAARGLAEFRDQVRKTVSYLKTHRPDLAPPRLWLTGGGATIPNVLEYLVRELDFPIQTPELTNDCEPMSSRTPPALLANAIALSALCWEVRHCE